MKLLFLIRDLNEKGGTERVSTVIANNLLNRGYEIIFVTIEPYKNAFFNLHEAIEIISLNKTKKNFYFNYINNIFLLRNIIKKNKVDIVIDVCTSLSLITLPAILGINIKHVSWEHFHAALNWNFITNRTARRLISLFSDKIVTLTQRDKLYYEKYLSAKNVEVILNPITIDRKNAKMRKCEAITALNLDPTKKYILSVGRLTYQKGFDLLIKIWSKIVTEISGEWHLLIIGSGEDKDILINLISSLNLDDKITIIPSTNQIDLYYRASYLYLMTSRFEGLPLVLIETKFFGLPSISFDCPNGPREIINNNIDGFLIENFNEKEFISKLITILDDEKKLELLAYNCTKSLDQFKLEHIIDQWQKLLENL